ncbi:MAG TPA: YraN family protein [Candidatus Paceibacterota bacterium]|jgi:putative endonuclease|nr:YraN family protein [Candidatus Paceibacterota bacterium]
MTKSKTAKQKVGEIGENVACRFLVKQGFEIIERNYWKKWGEIDVIAKKEGILHFIEVKTVSCENLDSVTREIDAYKPEDNVHPWKLKRLSRTIQIYLLEKENDDTDWQFDVLAIYLDMANRKAKVSFLEDIVI